MFTKRAKKNTLALNSEESKKIEFKMMGSKEIQVSFEKKEVVHPRKNLILLRPQPKETIEGKNKDAMNMVSKQRMIKYLSNDIIDMKRNIGEGTSNQRPYKPFLRRPIPHRAIEPPPANLNL